MGSVVLSGATSGATTITPTDAVTATVTLPSTGGTLQTSGAGFTTNGVAYASSTSALATGSGLVFTGTNLGIGTTNPGSILQLNSGAVDCALRLRTTASGDSSSDGVDITLSTGNILYITNRENGATVFENNGSERARIDTSGNLLVGKTSDSDSTAGTIVYSYGAIKLARAQGNFVANFINTTTASSVGNITVNASSTTYATSSDYRLKENVQPMTGALSVVQQLKPVTYDWKVDGAGSQGFIAHELQAVVPECVTGEKDEVDADGNPRYQGIDTSFLVATLTSAIQELSTLITAQQSTIQSLTERITALEGART